MAWRAWRAVVNSAMKRPDFFIIGAPKCGTTSMTNWLAEHPSVYMCPRKPTDFFILDMDIRKIRSLREYEGLFEGASDEHVAVGEASTRCLYSRFAVTCIEQYVSEPRYIVMIRNPIQMAPSFHQHAVYTGSERYTDFEEAWHMQDERAKGKTARAEHIDPHTLLYGPICRVGEQLERLYQQVPDERVLIVLLDDIRWNTRREYLRVLAFLGVPDDRRVSFPVHNPAKQWKSTLARDMAEAIVRAMKALGARRLASKLEVMNRRVNLVEQKLSIDSSMRSELVKYFADDISTLEQILDRDLSDWIRE